MKVFVIVGTVFPFDRLIRIMEEWALSNPETEVLAQVGKSNLTIKKIRTFHFLNAEEFNRIYAEADLIVSHAGMGVVLKALTLNKPIVIFPRRLELKEHNTDHQMATAKALDSKGLVNVAWDEKELLKMLGKPSEIISKKQIGRYASEELISGLRNYISSI